MTDRPTYTPVYKNGARLQIQGMAASSIGRKWYQVSTCDRCGANVAWAQSSKTGKWYVCETAEYRTAEAGNERFRAVPYKFHTCREPEFNPRFDDWDREANYEPRSIEQRAMGDD